MNSIEPSKIKINDLILLFNKKQFDKLLLLSNKLLNDFPNSILIQNLQGVVYTELKNYKLAKNLFIKVVNLNPKYTDGYYNLANIYNKLDEQDKAIEYYNKVIELDNNYFKAHNNIGNIYRKKGLNRKAIECYLSTLEINSNYKVAYYNLAGALQFYILDKENKYINKYLLYLLKNKAIVRPNAIASNIINCLNLNSDLQKNLSIITNGKLQENLNSIIKSFNKNHLLLQFMKVCPIPDYDIESSFIKIRKEILNQIYELNFEKIYTEFMIALSAQCFLNEYVYYETKEEFDLLEKIDARINYNLKNKKKVNELEILCISCYKPLNKFNWCKLVNPSDNLVEIFRLQFENFEIEKKLSKSIKTITEVRNKVSFLVKKQYEENPYPRWTNLGLSIHAKNIKDVIKEIDLNVDLKKVNFSRNPEILIAGCGTGQHAITTASKFKNANIFALDLSFNSLAYAKREAKELSIKNIEFIQGDLLDLKSINKKFDIIESVGVLHHMEDPFIGWKTLVEHLKDESLMLIGLYSERARENISKIKNKIKKLKIEISSKNIINFRKDIFKNKETIFDNIKFSPDFYSTSGVRDLLFHIQEHKFNLRILKKYLEKLDLDFVGFEDKLVIEKFQKVYRNKNDLYNLNKWEDYEDKHPRIFAGMYQFWCQKKK